MKRKSFVALLLAVVMAVVAMFTLVGCGNDEADNHAPDNSFEGSLSAQSYETVDQAAEAFLSVELNGAATQTTFVSKEVVETLTEEQIAELNLGDEIDKTEVESAELYEVSYTSVTPTALLNSAAEGTKTARVIVIKIGSVYWYYVPLFKNGDCVTDSYMSNILDSKKYTNFTETLTAESTVSAQGQSATVKIITTTKVTENAIYYKQSIPSMKETVEYYLVQTEEGLEMFQKYSSGWSSMGIKFDSVDDFLEEAFNIDHSYFIKTTSGFKLNSEKIEAYLDDVLGDLVNQYRQSGMSVKINSVSGDYYVKDARLDSINAKVTMRMTMQGQTANVTVTSKTVYSGFGTTTVNLPADIAA